LVVRTTNHVGEKLEAGIIDNHDAIEVVSPT